MSTTRELSEPSTLPNKSPYISPLTEISNSKFSEMSVLAICKISMPSSVSASTLRASMYGLVTLLSINPSTSCSVRVNAVNVPVLTSYCKSPAAPIASLTRVLEK